MIIRWDNGDEEQVDFGDELPKWSRGDSKRPSEVELEIQDVIQMIQTDDKELQDLFKFYLNHLINGLGPDGKITMIKNDVRYQKFLNKQRQS